MSKYSNMKVTDISENDKEEISEIIKTHCVGLFENGNNGKLVTIQNESIVMIVAFARKSEFATPLLTHFVDVYSRYSINNWLRQRPKDQQQNASVSWNFYDNYKFMLDLQQTSPKLYEIFVHLVTTFHKRVFSFPDIGSALSKYDDDLGDYIEITKELNKALRGIVCFIYFM